MGLGEQAAVCQALISHAALMLSSPVLKSVQRLPSLFWGRHQLIPQALEPLSLTPTNMLVLTPHYPPDPMFYPAKPAHYPSYIPPPFPTLVSLLTGFPSPGILPESLYI